MESKGLNLAEIFQSGMMLQRDKEIVLYGEAAPDSRITAVLYQDGIAAAAAEGSTAADTDGQFKLTLPSQNAGEGFSLRVSAADSRTSDTGNAQDGTYVLLENIIFGDVWLAGGQSNMEFFLRYDKDWEQTRKLPRNPKIRMYNVPQRAFDGHTTHNKAGYGYWFDDSDPGTEYFSAPAYSFARNVQEATGVPIGIIGCNWGGSSASTWVPKQLLQAPPLDNYLKEYEAAVVGVDHEKLKSDSLAGWTFEDSDRHGADFEPLLYGRDRDWQLTYIKEHAGEPVVPMGPYNFNRPGGLYDTMLSKLIPFSIKGVLWYQGESDSGDRAPYYDKLMTALIEDWRREWNDPFPFLMVQLAPFGVWLECVNDGYAIVREKQEIAADQVPDVYLASIMDIGSYYDIHPKEKMEVGRRLALLARGHVYGESELLCDPPRAVKALLTENGEIKVSFEHGEGLCSDEKASDWAIRTPVSEETSVSDKNALRPTSVRIEGCNAILTLPEMIDAAAVTTVSLGDGDYSEIHIHNAAGLSAMPFRIVVKPESAD